MMMPTVGIQRAVRIHRITHAVPPGRVAPAIVKGIAPASATGYQADDRPQYSQKDEHKHQRYKSHDKHEENEQGVGIWVDRFWI
jgi:hypothetical protein